MDNPLYIMLVSTVVPSGDRMTTYLRVSPELLDAVTPEVKEIIRQHMIAERDRVIVADAPGQWADPAQDRWWIGDDAPDAFIRNRDPKPLEWGDE